MSRSYKKHPISKEGKSAKAAKKMANRKLRRSALDDFAGKNMRYKKYFPQYDIHDWVNYWSWEQAKCDWEHGSNGWLRKHYPTLQEFFRHWLLSMKSK